MPLKELRPLESVWPRHALNQNRVQLFASIIQGGGDLPAIEVVASADGYLVADGIHRVLAAEALERQEIDAELVEPAPGETPEACAYRRALETASRSALPLTNAERKTAVLRLLRERSDLSHRAIASIVGVSHDSVDRWAKEPAEPQAMAESATPRSRSSYSAAVRSVGRMIEGLDAAADGEALDALRDELADGFMQRWSGNAAEWVRATAFELRKIAKLIDHRPEPE